MNESLWFIILISAVVSLVVFYLLPYCKNGKDGNPSCCAKRTVDVSVTVDDTGSSAMLSAVVKPSGNATIVSGVLALYFDNYGSLDEVSIDSSGKVNYTIPNSTTNTSLNSGLRRVYATAIVLTSEGCTLTKISSPVSFTQK